jgi:hypothetical protein
MCAHVNKRIKNKQTNKQTKTTSELMWLVISWSIAIPWRFSILKANF